MRPARVKLVGMCAVLAVGVVAGCGGDDGNSGAATFDPEKPAVNVAVVAFSVPGANYANEFSAGAGAAEKYINEELGGFGGREVRLQVCDTKGDPAVTTSCANDTLKNEPVAMFGCDPNWGTNGLPVYKSKGVMSSNCTNTPTDFTSPFNIAWHMGSFGEYAAQATFLCDQGAETVAGFASDTPINRTIFSEAFEERLADCGAEFEMTYYSPTAADLTPQLNKVAEPDPDWIVLQGGQPQMVQMLKSLHSSGFPADQRIVVGTMLAKENVLDQAGEAADGLYGTWEFENPNSTDDPDIKIYRDAMEAAGVDDWQNQVKQWGFVNLMTIYRVAEKIGFNSFDAASFTEFAQSNTAFDVFGSRDALAEGPAGYESVVQPAVRVLQWKGGELKTVTSESVDEEGWLNGF